MKIHQYMNVVLNASYSYKAALCVGYYSPNEPVNILFILGWNSHFTSFSAEHNVIVCGYFTHILLFCKGSNIIQTNSSLRDSIRSFRCPGTPYGHARLTTILCLRHSHIRSFCYISVYNLFISFRIFSRWRCLARTVVEESMR